MPCVLMVLFMGRESIRDMRVNSISTPSTCTFSAPASIVRAPPQRPIMQDPRRECPSLAHAHITDKGGAGRMPRFIPSGPCLYNGAMHRSYRRPWGRVFVLGGGLRSGFLCLLLLLLV